MTLREAAMQSRGTGAKRKRREPKLAPFWLDLLLRCHFLGFAFGAQHLERAFGFLVLLGHLLLYLRSGLFEFRREADVAVVLHAGAGGDEAADDDVLLESAQVVHRA